LTKEEWVSVALITNFIGHSISYWNNYKEGVVMELVISFKIFMVYFLINKGEHMLAKTLSFLILLSFFISILV